MKYRRFGGVYEEVFEWYLFDEATIQAIWGFTNDGWVPQFVLRASDETALERHHSLERIHGKENVLHYQFGAYIERGPRRNHSFCSRPRDNDDPIPVSINVYFLKRRG